MSSTTSIAKQIKILSTKSLSLLRTQIESAKHAYSSISTLILSPLLSLYPRLPKLLQYKFVKIDGSRIGHICPELWIAIARKNVIKDQNREIYFVAFKKQCNKAAFQIAKRELGHSLIAKFMYGQLSNNPKLRHYCLPAKEVNSIRDINMYTSLYKVNPFTPQEDLIAKNWLISHGYTEGQKLVCLLSRDSLYLNQCHGVNATYHNYRNSDINTYANTIKWLTRDCGAFVIRMGNVAQNRLPIDSSNFIDYPFLKTKREILDIWLLANCDFYISTGTGQDIVAAYSQKPGIQVNYNPLVLSFSYSQSYTVPKKLVWNKTGRPLTIREHFDNSYTSTDEYRQAKIDIIDLTSAEITRAVKKAWNVYIDKGIPDIETLKETGEFIELAKGSVLHGRIHKEFYVSISP